MDKIKLLGDRVLVEVESGEKMTANGLLLAKVNGPEDNVEGIVVKKGNGKQSHDSWIPINENIVEGAKVLFNYGKEILLNGKKYFLVREEDIIMVIQ